MVWSTCNSLRITVRSVVLLAAIFITACSSPEDKAQNYYERGAKLLAQRDYVKAGVEFKNAVQIKKDFLPAWRGLLEAESHRENYAGVLAALRTIVDLDPKDASARLELGRFMLLGNSDQALDLANAAIDLDPHNPNALALRAAVLLKLKDTIGAKSDAQAALNIDPKNVGALIVLASERAASGDVNGALLILDRRGPGYEKDDLAIQILKLRLLGQSGDLKQAETLLRELMVHYPKEKTFRKNLITLYVSQRRFEDAEKELRAVAAADPSDSEAGLNVVRFLQQVKGVQVAREELLSRIKGAANSFKYEMALAELDYAQGNLTDSAQLLERLASNARSPEDGLAAQLKLAQIQFRQKKFDASEALVASILQKDSRYIEGLKLRALIHMQRGQLDLATADLRQALNDQPRSSELMEELATAYERSGAIELAEKQYADAAKTSGFDATLTLKYVAFLRRRGSIEYAENVATDLVRRWPSNLEALWTLADIRLARQNWIGAQEIAEAIKRSGNAAVQADRILAAALSGQGKYTDSIKILEDLQAATPATVQPIAALVSGLTGAQKFDQAISFLQGVLKANPANVDALVMLGSVQLLKNQPDPAVQSFKAAITQQPKYAPAYLALANFYIREKNFDEAEKIVRAGLQQQGDDFSLRQALAGALELKGDYEAAIAEYEGLLKQEPGSLIAANNLASLLSDRRTDKASLERAYSVAAVLRKSQIPSFKDTLGWIDYLRGEYRSAIGLLEDAAAALPHSALVQYHLGMSYAATGQMAKALEKFKRALELEPDRALQEKISEAQKKAAG